MKFYRNYKEIVFFVASAAMTSTPAKAINWCGLPEIIPTGESDFEKILPKVQSLTGCITQKSDSYHHAIWECSDNPDTIDVYEGAVIQLIRKPGNHINLLVSTYNINNLNILRACGLSFNKKIENFHPENVAIRDYLEFRPSKNLTLTYIIDGGPATIVGGTHHWNEKLWKYLYGIRGEAATETGVRLAGLSPISNYTTDIVSAFENRGSKIINNEKSPNKIVQNWTISPPLGLSGVKLVNLESLFNYLSEANYLFEGFNDYKRYVTLLDDEYGFSQKEIIKNCIYRNWESGSITILGEACKNSYRIRFLNGPIIDQVSTVLDKIENNKNKKIIVLPAIDRDMF